MDYRELMERQRQQAESERVFAARLRATFRTLRRYGAARIGVEPEAEQGGRYCWTMWKKRSEYQHRVNPGPVHAYIYFQAGTDEATLEWGKLIVASAREHGLASDWPESPHRSIELTLKVDP